MNFALSRYHPEVVAVLGLDGNGQRPLPLVAKKCLSEKARGWLRGARAEKWFPEGYAPEAALAGLWLYFSCFEESHSISQDLHSAEGAYWHGILHRQEPDNWNAKYWFRQVAQHPVHAPLRDAAIAIIAENNKRVKLPATWDPLWFADLYDAVLHDSSHPLRREVILIQLAEWQLLFDYCATSHETKPAGI